MVLGGSASSSGESSDDARADDSGAAPVAIVADELALVRSGITAVLEARGIEVFAQTRSGRELVSLATMERPDLVVVGAPADLDVADVVRLRVRLGQVLHARPLRYSGGCRQCNQQHGWNPFATRHAQPPR